MVVAALAMGGLLWLTARLLPAPGADAHGLAHAMLLMVLISGTIAVYGLLLAVSGAVRWSDAVNAVRPSAAGDLRD